MELKKNIKVNVYEVIADYKVKIENAPFIAILKFTEENNGYVDSNLLHYKLLKPLSEKACKNLLSRLKNMGYMTENYAGEYILTELGYQSAQKEEFFEQRTGLLKLYVAEDNEFIPQRVVKIQEISMGKDADRENDDQSLTRELKSILKAENIIDLRKESYILEHFEEQCKILKSQYETLIFTAKESGSFIKIMDFEDSNELNRETLKSELLINQYGYAFDSANNLLNIEFNPNELSFFRNIQIENPRISRTRFEPATIKNVKVSPEDFNEAKQWHSALITEKINKYFLSDNEFTEYSNKVANEFDLFKNKLQNITSRKELAQKLNKKDDFYKIAKLETIDFLNY